MLIQLIWADPPIDFNGFDFTKLKVCVEINEKTVWHLLTREVESERKSIVSKQWTGLKFAAMLWIDNRFADSVHVARAPKSLHHCLYCITWQSNWFSNDFMGDSSESLSFELCDSRCADRFHDCSLISSAVGPEDYLISGLNDCVFVALKRGREGVEEVDGEDCEAIDACDVRVRHNSKLFGVTSIGFVSITDSLRRYAVKENIVSKTHNKRHAIHRTAIPNSQCLTLFWPLLRFH